MGLIKCFHSPVRLFLIFRNIVQSSRTRPGVPDKQNRDDDANNGLNKDLLQFLSVHPEAKNSADDKENSDDFEPVSNLIRVVMIDGFIESPGEEQFNHEISNNQGSDPFE